MDSVTLAVNNNTDHDGHSHRVYSRKVDPDKKPGVKWAQDEMKASDFNDARLDMAKRKLGYRVSTIGGKSCIVGPGCHIVYRSEDRKDTKQELSTAQEQYGSRTWYKRFLVEFFLEGVADSWLMDYPHVQEEVTRLADLLSLIPQTTLLEKSGATTELGKLFN